jgi:hypothetical protein
MMVEASVGDSCCRGHGCVGTMGVRTPHARMIVVRIQRTLVLRSAEIKRGGDHPLDAQHPDNSHDLP